MVREFLVELYLLFIKIQFNFFKLFPLKDKVTFIVSFKDNCHFVYNEMKKQQITDQIIFLCEASSFEYIKKNIDEKVLLFEANSVKDMVKSVYHIATSKNIIIDNYFAFLSAVTFKEGVQCTQLWHAAGAIKCFGMKDKSNSRRSKRSLRRFQRVYSHFDKVIVGSDAMVEIFKEAFNLNDANFLYTGIPRTDLFYNEEYQITIKKRLLSDNPHLKNKKVIFYVPTFRDNLSDFNLVLDVEKMFAELGTTHVLMIKLHPAIKNKLEIDNKLKDFVFDYSTYDNINDLLFITDILITDYSSIPYEFSLLNKPMIFYPYDLAEYQASRGIWGPYESLVPGPVVFDTEEIIEIIKNEMFDLNKITEFCKKWNKYSLGNSSENLINCLPLKRNSLYEGSKNV